ncbi:MAG TPA: tetratricopeptide repeat protein [Bryobacteraceae bacterium]|nr:tetratricopeptide repeat protein [Bryobacteraceae bacterium]
MKMGNGRWVCLSLGMLLICCAGWGGPAQEALAHFRSGRLLGEAGDMQAAAKEFRQAIRLQSDYAEAHYFLALTLIAAPIDRLDWPQAASECRAALKSRPAYPEASHLLGVALAAMGQQTEAIEQFRSALRLRPNYPEAHLDLGMAYAAESKVEAATNEYREALAVRPQYAEARERLAKCLFEQGKAADARTELIAALRINPDLADSHYLLGRVLVALHEEDAAKLEFRQVQQLHNRRVLATEAVRLSNAGLDAARQGDMPGALKNLRQAVEKKPDLAIAHYNLGLVLADAGHLEEGIEEVREAISLAPLVTRMQVSLNRMLAQRGGGVEEQEGAPADTSDRHVNRGRASAHNGDQLAAIGEYLRALTLAPANIDARAALEQAYRVSGDVEDATLEAAKLKLFQPGKATP